MVIPSLRIQPPLIAPAAGGQEDERQLYLQAKLLFLTFHSISAAFSRPVTAAGCGMPATTATRYMYLSQSHYSTVTYVNGKR